MQVCMFRVKFRVPDREGVDIIQWLEEWQAELALRVVTHLVV